MRERAWGNEFRTTKVCVDSYANGEMKGRFYNSHREEGVHFQSLTQFLVKVEQMINEMDFPQSFTAARTFAAFPEQTWERPSQDEPPDSLLATFAVQVLFRQNASWQGSVTWLNKGKEQTFRSVLELIFLIDSALSEVQLEQGA